MLIGISPLISPELLTMLYCMGHGDELVLADAHFPGYSCNDNVIRADGLNIDALLDAILPHFILDDYVEDNLVMMAAVEGDTLDQTVQTRYRQAIETHWPAASPIVHIPRMDFYARSKDAYGVVITGETAKYGNIIIKKGVTPVEG